MFSPISFNVRSFIWSSIIVLLTFAGFHWKLGQQHNCVTRFKGKVHDQIRAICCADVV